MQKCNVLWSDIAKLDLYEIVDFIADESPANAFRILDRIEKKAATLESNPRRGKFCSELLDVGIKTYRELILRPWRIVYRIEGKTVHIIGIFDGRRNPAEILSHRISRN